MLQVLFLLLVGLVASESTGFQKQKQSPKTQEQQATGLPHREHRNSSLLWGPYRPNLYLGIRPRNSSSLLTGLMWSRADTVEDVSRNLRHECEQDGVSFGYSWFDPRIGGSQKIQDAANGVDLSTDFVKHSEDSVGSSWALTVSGALRGGVDPYQKTTLIFYIARETTDASLTCRGQAKGQARSEAPISCKDDASDLPRYTFDIFPRPQRQQDKTALALSVSSLDVDVHEQWQAKETFLEQLKRGKNGIMLERHPGKGNLHLLQMTFKGGFAFDVHFTSGGHILPYEPSADGVQRGTGQFTKRFKSVYWPQVPFMDQEYAKLSKFLLSNLLGGIGFFHGSSKANADVNAEKEALKDEESAVVEQGPYSLFSTVPSRSFFPRGFLWDEGFHLQVVLDWDLDLAIEILNSWLGAMDENGWVAREQILGPEARSKVPPEFQTQYQSYANPPTLFIVVDMMFDRLTGHTPYNGRPSVLIDRHPPLQGLSPRARQFFEKTYAKLRKYYFWYRRTQVGSLDKYQYLRKSGDGDFTEGYRWRGRTASHILTSGLDDYPRAETPSTEELHLDALCWTNLMATILRKLAIRLNEGFDSHKYERHIAGIRHTVGSIHWSKSNSMYCDTTISGTTGRIEHVCHKGYVSLLPLLTNTMASDDHVSAALDIISDKVHLWSPYGLRSLSTEDEFYGEGENYWRSPIWVNMNYMALVKLLDLAQTEGPHQERSKHLYSALRKNIVNTVFQSWKETGVAWEQYNPDSGRGQRTKHFTGWTSLIVKIMAMPDLGGDTSDPPSPALHMPPKLRAAHDYWRHLLFAMSLLVLGLVWQQRRIARLIRSAVRTIW